MTHRRAVVTGASRGIGRALALELGRRGSHVTCVARSAAALTNLVEGIVADGGSADACVADVSDTDAWVRTLRKLDENAPHDLVIANAGVGLPAPDASPIAWESVAAPLRTNTLGAAATLTALLPAMVARGSGHVVAIGSLASFGPIPGSAAYCAPKAGVDMLMACLSLDLRGTGVSATNVRLGFVRTAMTEKSTHPMPQAMEPDEAARVVLDGLGARPETIVHPRALGAAARALAWLPGSARGALFRIVDGRAR